MQTLDVISVNLWQILISLINLVLLFLILKKFLFKPVKNTMDKRKKEIDDQYAAAAAAQALADENRDNWENKLSTADKQADAILLEAEELAKKQGEKLIAEAKERADAIIRNAEEEIALEKQKAATEMKQQIVEVSEALTEKMLEREINTEDHRALIDSFIEKIGEEND